MIPYGRSKKGSKSMEFVLYARLEVEQIKYLYFDVDVWYGLNASKKVKNVPLNVENDLWKWVRITKVEV